MVMGEGMVVDLVGKKQNKTGSREINCKLHSVCVLWVNSSRTETLGEPSVFCSFSP